MVYVYKSINAPGKIVRNETRDTLTAKITIKDK